MHVEIRSTWVGAEDPGGNRASTDRVRCSLRHPLGTKLLSNDSVTTAQPAHAVAVALDRALGGLALHAPGDPEQDALWETLRRALNRTWADLHFLGFEVQETGLRWLGDPPGSTAPPLALGRILYRSGLRSLTLVPDSELEEIVRFVTLVHRAEGLTADDEDDLRTLLWKQDFQRIQYTSETVATDASTHIEEPDLSPTREPQQLREQVREEAKAAPPPSGVVRLEKFDSTLYFLDRHEVEYLTDAIHREYAQDPARSVVDLLLDIVEVHADGDGRAEAIAVLEEILPHLLATGNFVTAAYLLGQLHDMIEHGQGLGLSERRALAELSGSLSDGPALLQLFHTLEDTEVDPSLEGLSDLLLQLKPQAFPTVLQWMRAITRGVAGDVLLEAIDRWAQSEPQTLAFAIRADDKSTVHRALKLIERLKIESAVDLLVELHDHSDPRVRSAGAEALEAVGTAKAYRHLAHMVDDPDPDVRLVVLEALARRPYPGALAPLQRLIDSPDLGERDLAESRALFEAYGSTVGGAGVAYLAPLLSGKGGSGRRRVTRDIRACAALALGKIGTPGAREALEKALRDRDPVVRSAAGKALRAAG